MLILFFCYPIQSARFKENTWLSIFRSTPLQLCNADPRADGGTTLGRVYHYLWCLQQVIELFVSGSFRKGVRVHPTVRLHSSVSCASGTQCMLIACARLLASICHACACSSMCEFDYSLSLHEFGQGEGDT